jgi:NAD(P)-dependent dehydrogenase (short-subunit alcohol dehydrogenase family)
MGINLKGAYFTIQKALPLMQKGGAIVLNASVAHGMGIPNASVYSAAKAGIRSLARCLAAELVNRGIRVNCVSPGAIETAIMAHAGMSEEQKSAVRKYFTDSVPMKRFGSPEETARAVLFLASDEASFVTGVDLPVDGGWLSC